MDNLPFSEEHADGPEFPGFDEPAQNVRPDAGGKKPVKPFPLGKVLGGSVSVLVICGVGAAFIGNALKPKANQDQFSSSIPQPSIASQAVQPGTPQYGNPAALAAQPQQAYQPPPLPNAQMAQQGAPAGMQVPVAQQQMPQQAAQQSVAQPAMQAAGSMGAANGSPSAGTVQPAYAQQGQIAQTQSQQAQNDVTGAQVSPPQAQPVNAAPANPVTTQVAQQPAQPAAQPDTQRAAAPVPASADMATQLAQLQRTVERLEKQLSTNGREPKHVKAAQAPRAAPAADADADAQSSDDQQAASAAPDHADRAQHGRANKKKRGEKAVAGDNNKQDTSYVLTGMIGGRAFISKKGGSDVNPDDSVVAGGALDDGRKVIMVDQKLKRVWLSGGQYISADGTGSGN
ncbi:hypothetical protein R70006_04998 [Paraburkholderia domus]|nr:hypothetical protein R70006_04998 [Paraburkholderia domus]